MSAPSISVQLSIHPPRFTPGSQPPPSLSITATSHATQPITIFTWPEIFNLALAQRRKNFTCLNLTTNTAIRLETTKGPKRTAFSQASGGRDDKAFVTLEPEIPVTFTDSFKLGIAQGERCRVEPGHRYRFGVNEGEEIWWWQYGRKEDVMKSPDSAGMDEPSGLPIALDNVAPVEFEVEGSE
ncbi:hypothetical protein ASPWEDRAFT_182773 [Aspergillus wentii DTO 134E9]|uniref:Uncharacterized protein n=1 Tax=Aspergillus wentii DTO 134E9 TaxID=1073089 RepID=A0A1L9RSU6_ASPWE|nr:uncharacterized protein ASPWEDRAFT_182773 [Aspergillus wentii DTO 134E9]KAI9930812.1 hypothetical protein MW887_011570 [Aspergillus wentii]OJJ37990.1 hypothetical protein ASPWEDRAFT_182773 [Aspergillus wentii DTO 134E9]